MARTAFRSLRIALIGAALLTALTTGLATATDRVSADVDDFGLSAAELAQMQHLPSVSAAGQRFTPSARGSTGFVRPVIGPITTPFGERGPYWRLGYHPGIDLGVPIGTPVKAVTDGVVLEAESDGYNSGYGSYVKIDHGNGLESLYAHLSTLRVQPGDQIAAGQVIGLSGNTGFSTGPHLHLEIRQNGEKRDPAPYLGL
jgi:murein DD-endopeptidase MepM/ murein hydrolase activator NlpD